MLFLGGGGEARVACHNRIGRGIIGRFHGGNIIHVRLDIGKDIRRRHLMNLMLLLRGGICATKRDTASVVDLYRAFGCLVRSQEGLFTSPPR